MMKQFLCRLVGAIALLASVVVAGSATVLGQRYYSPDFSIGVKGGATLSRMDFVPHISQNMTPGMTFGIMARYSEEKLFGLLGELNITQRGWAEDFRGLPVSYSRHLTYIQLPLMTQIRFGWKRVKLFVNLGPEAGYMLGDKIKSDFDYSDPVASVPGYSSNRHNEQMTMDVANRFDYGIAGGLGAEFFVARRHSITLEGRFYYGIGNIFRATRTSTFSASRGLSVEITLGYFFRVI